MLRLSAEAADGHGRSIGQQQELRSDAGYEQSEADDRPSAVLAEAPALPRPDDHASRQDRTACREPGVVVEGPARGALAKAHRATRDAQRVG
jgi:hypothetical protein